MYREILVICLVMVLLVGVVRAEENKTSASLMIEKAEKTITEMMKMGFGVTYANDTLNEAKVLFSQGYYLGAEALASKVLEIKEKAESVKKLIDQVESRIYEVSSKGYNVSDALELFNSGLKEFEVDNYADAEELMNEALNKLEEIEAEESIKAVQKQSELISPLLDNLWLLIIVGLLMLITGFKTKNFVDKRRMKNKIKNLKKEEFKIKKLIKNVQNKYFVTNEISKMDYEMAMKRYMWRLSWIKKEIKLLENRITTR